MHLPQQLVRSIWRRPQLFAIPCNQQQLLQSRPNATAPATTPAPASATAAAVATTDEWITIYKFPQIQLVASLNRLKVYQAALTSLAVPICMGLEAAAVLPASSADVVAALGITGTAALSIASLTVGRNVVGFAYVDRLGEPSRVRLAVPDFWGRRRNVVLPVAAIDASEERRRVPMDLYRQVQCGGAQQAAGEGDGDGEVVKKETFKLVHRQGEILRPEEFTYVFGEV